MLKIAFLFATLCSPTVHAWGAIGHEAVGYVAMSFLAPNALEFVQNSLGPKFDESLGPAATWADTVKFRFRWSAPNHFIDAEDSPLDGICNVSESRDCPSGFCLLTAISNYTLRIQDTSLSAAERSDALKFLDHFIGDIGQPLHVEALARGGNDIHAKCHSKSTNLHSVWDSGMLETNVDALYGGSSQKYADALVANIQSGVYASEAPSWISCSSITAIQPSGRISGAEPTSRVNTFPQLQCPLIWAEDSNTLDCSVVFNFTTGQDLCKGSYFKTAIPLIDLQIAKQGYRLAAWLNVIFDGDTQLEVLRVQ